MLDSIGIQTAIDAAALFVLNSPLSEEISIQLQLVLFGSNVWVEVFVKSDAYYKNLETLKMSSLSGTLTIGRSAA